MPSHTPELHEWNFGDVKVEIAKVDVYVTVHVHVRETVEPCPPGPMVRPHPPVLSLPRNGESPMALLATPSPQANPTATAVAITVTFLDSAGAPVGAPVLDHTAPGVPKTFDIPAGAATATATEDEITPAGPSPESVASAALTLPAPPPPVAPAAPTLSIV